MKKLLSILILCLIPVSVLAFDDVSESGDYSQAIFYLRDKGIVGGYPDGDFRPNNDLNRAELTKIVVESLNLELVDERDCFPDLLVDQWYAPYVCTAKQQGWIQGYPDGTFKPEQKIINVESIKIIGEAEGWELTDSKDTNFTDLQLDQWYVPYVVFAENKNFLPFSGNLNPASFTTRGQFSEIYFRILVTEERGEDRYTSDQINEDGLSISTDGILESEEYYSKNSFDNVILEADFPAEFLENEVYYFDGEIDSGDYESAFAFIFPEGQQEEIQTFSSDVVNDNFSIPVYFQEEGTYFIGLIPGTSGSSKITKVQIDDDLLSISSLDLPAKATNLSASFSNDQTKMSFSHSANLVKLVLEQGSERVEYLSRQGLGSIDVNYLDFEDFNEGQVTWSVQTANVNDDFTEQSGWNESTSKTFSAVTHQRTQVSTKINSLPVFYTPGDRITISGKAETDLDGELAVIRPDGFVDETDKDDDIQKGDNFFFEYKTSISGTYIIEVNTVDGEAVVNHPVYQSGKIPLIPDFFDLNPLELSKDKTISETSEKTRLLDYINDARQDVGLSPVVLDSELSNLARAHAEDMIAEDYFGHVNLDGQTPNDRRVAAGIDTYVGENITVTTSTRHAHEGLMRSAIHRDNVLSSDWTKVGLAVIKDSEGYFYVVQEFSTSLSFIYNAVIDYINDERPSDIDVDSDLQEHAEYWTELMVEEDFFDTSYEGETIFDSFDASHDYAAIRAFIVSGSGIELITDSIIDSTDVEKDTWTDLGLGLLVNDNGAIVVTLIYAR